MPGTLGAPINAGLQFQPGGDPYAAYAAGGIAGLGQSYASDYASYLNTNQANYNNIIGGYQTVQNNIAQTLGQGGTDWGIAQPAANQIVSQGNKSAGGAIQNSINSGVGKSTAAVAAQRGVTSDTQQALGQLGSSLAGTYAGYEANLGQSQLAFMNSVNAPPPNSAAYNALFQQYGQQQQAQANLAMQQQALQQQQRSANQAASRSMAGGGGGVSIPQAPRGGTYGSGSSGFPSGGGVSSIYGGIATSNVGVNNSAGAYRPSGSGGQSITPGGTPDPWDPFAGQEEDPYQGLGDPTQVVANFGNEGYYLGSGVA